MRPAARGDGRPARDPGRKLPMLRFFCIRLLAAIPTLFIISLIVFSLQLLLPGDVALVIAGGEATPEALAVFNREYAAVQAVTLLSGYTFVVMSLVGDVLCFGANPKLRSRSL
jgi:ABC-type dipeptide/oligopeptide/nickel transport system permease component